MNKGLKKFCVEIEAAQDYCDSHKEFKVVLLRELRHLVSASGMTSREISAEITEWLESLPAEERVVL